ncbi:ABC transporter substrate-binding protein [Nitratireductor sp. ZSWI3]|uniref:ABC transporter substrate-binding protein n=1 Tax=Nitratireductor sp. ZSWI3 TaxID=2966359 RepID=UPI00214FC6D4|nr:ABC transporter substrate-binding protein [Nitratireductor sp. ZSWI3]MCR4265255.1 ABC transporter substrate-binding protein [Nitratireductor sp. ZSWI3]
MRTCLLASSVALAVAAGVGSAMAGKADDTLNAAFTKELESVDSYFNSAREGVILQRSIWDGLLYLNQETGEYEGNLATSWQWVDDTTLELKLREGVKFHNGEEFDADDVVYTVNFVAKPENGVVVQRNVNWMKEAVKVDKYTVRIITNGPFPAAFEYLAGPVSIYPNEYYAEAGPAGMALKPVGTGPYQVESVEPGKHFVLKKYEGYHDSPKGRATIGTVDIRTIPDINTQLAELFSGGLDFIWGVPADQAEKLEAMGRFNVANESTMRIGYLELDAAGRSGEHPIKKRAVRQAIAHAIDRQAIVDSLLKGKSKVVNSACFPSQFGCEQDVAVYDYDPQKAKALLAEAGYPDGFTVDFYAYRDRPYAEAMLSYLANVGITANLKYLQYSALREMRHKGETSMSFQTWGSYSVNDASAITSQFFKHGVEDFARDDEVKAWLDKADTSIDPAVRKENYSLALKKIADEAYWVPLFSYNSNYVLTQDAEYTPTPDEVVRFFQVHWK